MIFSKDSLKVIGIIQKDKAVKILNNVLFTKTGIIIAACRNVIIGIDPIDYTIKSNLHLKENNLVEDILLSSENVKKILSVLPNDTLFKGLLEYFDLYLNKKTNKIEIRLHDGSQEHLIILNRIIDNFIPFKDVFYNTFNSINKNGYNAGDGRIKINLSRLNIVIETIERLTDDKTGEMPLYISIIKNGVNKQLIIQSINIKTGQKIIAISSLVEFNTVTDWIKESKIQKNFKIKI